MIDSTTPMTARQAAMLAHLREYIVENQRPPTLREIGAHFGITTTGVLDHLTALARRGLILNPRDASRETGAPTARANRILGDRLVWASEIDTKTSEAAPTVAGERASHEPALSLPGGGSVEPGTSSDRVASYPPGARPVHRCGGDR